MAKNEVDIERIPFVRLKEGDLHCSSTFSCSMQSHSFAIISLQEEMVNLIKEAHKVGKEFFNTTSKRDKEATKLLFHEYGDKGLVGYNHVSAAKEVYRIRRGTDQPWPISPSSFKSTMEQAFTLLEDILGTCYGIISRTIVNGREVLDGCVHGGELGEHVFSSSPFDLFHYFNDAEGESKGKRRRLDSGDVYPPVVTNCHEHVDPGFLTCIPCADTPGLTVVDETSRQWVEIEQYLEPHTDVTVIGCKGLQILSKGVYPAAVHKVVANNKPRLSLVYEMRPKVDFKFPL